MEYTKKVIELAIEGGFGGEAANQGKTKDKMYNEFLEFCTENWQSITLDPLFWQSLCKTLGLEGGVFEIPVADNNSIYYVRGMHAFDLKIRTDAWRYHWHSFIDTLASGQTPEQFFADLLTK